MLLELEPEQLKDDELDLLDFSQPSQAQLPAAHLPAGELSSGVDCLRDIAALWGLQLPDMGSDDLAGELVLQHDCLFCVLRKRLQWMRSNAPLAKSPSCTLTKGWPPPACLEC